MQNARLDEAQAGIKTARKNISNLRYADDTTLMAESKELKSLSVRLKEESLKACWKLNSKKLRSSHPVPSLHGKQKENKWKQWQILFSWAPKPLRMVSTARKLKDICSLEEKLWKISVLKSSDITFLIKVCIFKAMAFPVVMYRCESGTIKKAKGTRIDDS